MLRARTCLLSVFAAVLVGCGSLGLAPPESFNDRVGYALSTHTAILETATAALTNGTITVAEAEDLAAVADDARALIDSARAVHAAGQVDEATRRLVLVTTILQELQAYLGAAP